MIPFIHEIYCDNCDTLLVKENEKEKIKESKPYIAFYVGSHGHCIKYTPGEKESYSSILWQSGQKHFCNTKCMAEFIDKQK